MMMNAWLSQLLLLLPFLFLFDHDGIVVVADDDEGTMDTTSTTTSTTTAASSSCKSSTDCQNGGECFEGGDGIETNGGESTQSYCSCLPGISGGTFCEDTKCNLPCLNGGSCRHSYKQTGLSFPNDATLTYICECIEGYSGVLCEIILSSTTAPATGTATEADPSQTTPTGSGSGSNPNHVQEVGGSHHTEGGQLFDAMANNNNNNSNNRCRHTLSHECQNGGVCILSKDGNYCHCPHGTAGEHCSEQFDATTTTTTTTNSTDSSAAAATTSPPNSSTTDTNDECPTQCPPGTICEPSQYEFSEGRIETIYKCIVDDSSSSSSSSSTSQSQSGHGDGSNNNNNNGGCPLQCMNGSSCRSRDDVQTSTLSYSCECTPGFRGHQCEVPYQLCPLEFDLDDNTNPPRRHECWHGGVCQLDDRSTDQLNPSNQIYKCHCPLDYSGDRCEVLNQIPSSSSSSSSSSSDSSPLSLYLCSDGGPGEAPSDFDESFVGSVSPLFKESSSP